MLVFRRNVSSKWMKKMHGMLPLNLQEEHVKEVLEDNRFSYRVHEVFSIGPRSAVVDFFLPEQNVVIECWLSRSRRGVALNWVEKNAAYVDLKFKRLKERYPGIRCLALVQVPQVDLASLQEIVGVVMLHADFMAYSMDEFQRILNDVRGSAGTSH